MTPPHRSDPATIAEHLKPIIDNERAVFVALQYSPMATPSYELLSDSVYWDDEIPAEPNPDVLAVARYLLRTRIELAHAEWSAKDPTWEYFKKKVPHWPGFRPDRCGAELLRIYAQGRANMNLADE